MLTGTHERMPAFTLHRAGTHKCSPRKSRIQRMHDRVIVMQSSILEQVRYNTGGRCHESTAIICHKNVIDGT